MDKQRGSDEIMVLRVLISSTSAPGYRPAL